MANYQSMTMELSNDNVLNYKLYGQDMNDLWFDLTISNVGTTEIKDLRSFLSNNSTYTSTYNPHEIAKKIVDLAKDEAYGLKFNVYSNKMRENLHKIQTTQSVINMIQMAHNIGCLLQVMA